MTVMLHENYQRILKALHLEKWMTIRQLARLLFPSEYEENPRKIYDRINQNLRKLKTDGLLKSKDYGLGLDNLWAIKPHPIIRELGYSPPRAEIHRFKYEHEKACADVFVTLALTGNLCGWEAHKRIAKGIIPDRIAELSNTVYIEVEMGSQDKIRDKAERYRSHHRAMGESFQVWFLVNDERQVEKGLRDLEGFSDHYSIQTLTDFHSDTLTD